MGKKNASKKPIRQLIGNYIEQTVAELDPAITLVDHDLTTGDIIVLLKTGESLRISIVSES